MVVLSLLAILTSFFLVSCTKNDNNSSNDMFVVSGSASGSQVLPPVTGTATGNISGSYNRSTNLLSYNITWTGLTGAATSASFYNGFAGANGSLVQNTAITTSGSTGASVGTMTLTDAQETALLTGSLYYIVATSAHASGEIRGQMTATAQ